MPATRSTPRFARPASEVEYLVNNAGFGLFGKAVELDRAEQLGIIDVNIRALADLSLRFATSVIRHRGGLLNVGSIAGFLPGPGMAMYYASKAFVLSFTEALRQELDRTACASPCCVPDPCRRNFSPAPASGRVSTRPCWTCPPADVARQAYGGLMANKRAVLPGLGIKVVPLLLRLLPRGFILWAVGRFQPRKR